MSFRRPSALPVGRPPPRGLPPKERAPGERCPNPAWRNAAAVKEADKRLPSLRARSRMGAAGRGRFRALSGRGRVVNAVSAAYGLVRAVATFRAGRKVSGRPDLDFVGAVRAAVGAGRDVRTGRNRVGHCRLLSSRSEPLVRTRAEKTSASRSAACSRTARTRLPRSAVSCFMSTRRRRWPSPPPTFRDVPRASPRDVPSFLPQRGM